ncbi:MAG: sigma-70 family RNA polymerase sigma factor [Bacteroidales bacterium]|nr:sigma-70 family RNA polymerase sigma factor [Bacteroidales bacterium]MBR3096643.1 sigma-70 family RNA polymerase sigma factor [Bacteroidales bacterium]
MTEQEFAYLSDRIRGRLTALARRFNRASGMDAEAEDIVQDALVTLWQLAEKGYSVRDAEALAVKLTKTRCVERYRRQHIRFEPLSDQPVPGGYSATSDTDENDIRTIRGFVQRNLTDSQRNLLHLRNEQGLSLDEIAAATGRPKGSVKVALSTARKKMMEQWKKMK